MADRPRVGTIGWTELHSTAPGAARIFYAEVLDWASECIDIGDHVDYSMSPKPTPADPEPPPAAGLIRSTRQQATWIPYAVVADIEGALARALSLGGTLEDPVTAAAGWGKWCIIRDPFGASIALYESE